LDIIEKIQFGLLMIIDEDFINYGMYNSELSKAQYKILGQSYPPKEGWESLILGSEISDKDANLFILLKGKLAIKAQDQIIKNYQLMLEFSKKKEILKINHTNELLDSNIKSLEIYCDGACLDNPGKSGSGLSIYSENNDNPILLYGQYVDQGTNNTAELNALYKALSIASQSNASSITIFSDSKYSIDCITNWAYKWKNNSWTKKGGEIKNLDTIKIAHELYDSIKNTVNIEHVKGHAGIEGNELADRMAMMAIKDKVYDYKTYDYKNINDILDLIM